MSRFLASLATVLVGALAWPSYLLAKSGVRFVHAVPGANDAELTVEQAGRTTLVGRAGYSDATGVRAIAPGPIRWRLVSGGQTLATGTGKVGEGSVTAVAMPQGSRLAVRFFRDAARAPRRQARIRVIHASPELGDPDVQVDGRRVAQGLELGDATPYLSLSPGRHDLAAVRAGSSDEIVGRKGIRLGAQSATSAIVIGTAGRPARIVTVSDALAGGREQGAQSPSSRDADSTGAGGYTVKRGDSLWSIAADQLGDGASDARVARRMDALWRSNRATIGTGDPNLIFPGQRLAL